MFLIKGWETPLQLPTEPSSSLFTCLYYMQEVKQDIMYLYLIAEYAQIFWFFYPENKNYSRQQKTFNFVQFAQKEHICKY